MKQFGQALAFALTLLSGAAAAGERAFVLVHGAWTDGRYWAEVVDALRQDGAEVVAVNLPLGDPEITLADQARAIVAALPEGPATLVAHSAGTRPATAAWDIARGRIAAAAFVEGVPPVPGADLIAIPEDGRSLAWMRAHRPEVIASGLLPPPPALVARPGAAYRAHPIGPLYGAVPLSGGTLPDTPILYVTAADGVPDFKRIAALLAGVPGWSLAEIPGGHDVGRDAPGDLAALLLAWP